VLDKDNDKARRLLVFTMLGVADIARKLCDVKYYRVLGMCFIVVGRIAKRKRIVDGLKREGAV
jgi:hypothetical protein